MLPVCNTTLSESAIVENPLWTTAGKGVTWHHLALFIAAIFGLISIVISGFMIFLHATHYLRPWEQKHSIRILLMPVVYASVSFLSFLYYRHAVYFEVIRDCYEALAIASFFTLLCHYIAPNLHDQKEYFRALTPKNWFWGVFGLQKCTGGENKGPFRKPRSGLTWFNIIWIGVFQYCAIRVFMTAVAGITQFFGRYCESSLSPAFSHVWVVAFEAAGVTVAMFCIIQFYIQLKQDLADYSPFIKVVAIKLVIFFSFWQNIVISLLTSSAGPLKPTSTISYSDFKVGIPSVLICIEMAIFSVLHIFAFPWKEYSIKHHYTDPLTAPGSGYSGGAAEYKGGPMGIYALADAFNPWDVIKAFARGLRWVFFGFRKRELDSSYQNSSKLDNLRTGNYTGPTYAGTGDGATELRPSRGNTVGEDDRAGLLRNPAHIGRDQSSSPYRTYTNESYAVDDDERSDLGASHRLAPGKGADFDSDTAYHPGMDVSRMHPALRPQGQDHSRNHWDGASRQEEDDDSIAGRPPPSYRTNDARF